MSLAEIYAEKVFDDATTDELRARFYVRSGELGIEPRADKALMESLIADDAPKRIHVVGPSGAGKTSLILRVVADLARRELEIAHEVLVLRVGDRPENLDSPEAVMKLVLDTIAVNEYRFASIDSAVFQAAAADQRTANPAEVSHQAGVDAKIASYSASIRGAYETLDFGQSAARVRHDLEDVLRHVHDADYRPTLVLDDTEKFVSPGADGAIDIESIDNLYHHGVRVLGELDVDLVVAMHPRFEEVERVGEVSERLGMERMEVPELPADSDVPALTRILERRLERSAIEHVALEAVITPTAIEELQTLYHERNRDLRSVLKLAQRAAGHALDRDSERVEARDVRSVVAAASKQPTTLA